MICWTTESEALLASSPPSILLQQPLGRMLLDTGSVSNGIPETLRQLPETVRQVLNGCVGSVRTPERGGHITIYVTSADASGKFIFIRHQFVIFNNPCNDYAANGVMEMVDSVQNDLKELTNAKGVSLQILDPWGQRDAIRRAHDDDRIGRTFLSTLNRTSPASILLLFFAILQIQLDNN